MLDFNQRKITWNEIEEIAGLWIMFPLSPSKEPSTG